MIIKTVGGILLIGAMFFWIQPETIKSTSRNTQPRDSECLVFPDDSEKLPDGLIPCIITGYISGWTEAENCVRNGVVKPGAIVMMAAMNKIHGRRGDADKNGECEPKDAWEFSQCMTARGRRIRSCQCLFDYDQDGDVDLADFQHVQNAVGTGNKTWRKEHYPLNCCRTWE